jgi:hypothetical protein
MTVQPSSSDDPYAHLRTHAAAQKQETVDRLARAIAELEADGRPVTTFTIREVSGLDYMAYYRNRPAFQLFQERSTHLRKKREQEQAKRQAHSRSSKKRKQGKGRETLHAITVSPRDPLLDHKRPRLVQLLHEAEASRDEARQHVQVVQASIEQQAQTQRAELEQRYRKLLQEHMQCSVKIAKLEAQVAEYLAFMERFRTSLQREEHGTQQ